MDEEGTEIDWPARYEQVTGRLREHLERQQEFAHQVAQMLGMEPVRRASEPGPVQSDGKRYGVVVTRWPSDELILARLQDVMQGVPLTGPWQEEERMGRLERLANLRAQGRISDEEFQNFWDNI